MKKYIIAALGLGIFAVSDTSAQTTAVIERSHIIEKPPTNFFFGPEVGMQLSKMRSRMNSMRSNGDLTRGLRAGLVADFQLGKKVSFQPGFYYSVKGYDLTQRYINRIDNIAFIETMNREVTVRYLEIPVNIQVNIKTIGNGHMFLGGGPYAAIVLSGSIQNEIIRESTEMEQTKVVNANERELEVGDKAEEHDIESGDVGFNVNLGYRRNSGLFVRGHMDFGLANLMPSGWENNRLNTFSFGLTVGYLIGSN